MYNNLKTQQSKTQQILPSKRLSTRKSLTKKPSIKKLSIKKPLTKKPLTRKSLTKKPSIKKPSIKKSINNNKIVTYAVGSSIVRFNKNTITIYTNTEFDYNILYKPDFISKFNIKDYKSNSPHNQLISNELLNQNLNNNTINFKTNFKINNINTIQKNNTFTNINAKKNIWTTQTYNYNGNVFMNNSYTTKTTKYYSYTEPNFINNNIHTPYILVNLYDNIYLSISSHKIILFKTQKNDQIRNIKEYYTGPEQYLLLIGKTYSYYICVPEDSSFGNEISFYISNENYKKYNMSIFLYNNIVYKNSNTNTNTNTNSKTKNNIQNNKWTFIYKLPIKKTFLGITYNKYKEMEINNVLYEFIPLFSMRNHNYTFN